jgi:uncharacterized membrane protein (GlpM family)
MGGDRRSGRDPAAAGMSPPAREPTVRERVAERPSIEPAKALESRPRDLLIRFAGGALTSIISGAATLAFGARLGGILLAFPAILAASLTLIEEQDDSVDAREDARGAIAGGCAMTIFALAATLMLGHLDGAVALPIATAAWLAAASLIYLLFWWH